MKPEVLIRNLVKHQFEFSLGWYDWLDDGHWRSGGYEFYCINIILGNSEYVIPLTDHHGLNLLWEDIKTYYID